MTACAEQENRVSSIQSVAWIDDIIAEIFDTMLGTTCTPMETDQPTAEECVASVVFGDRPQNVCEVALSEQAADLLVLQLTGTTECSLRADATGELCNMIAGGWKALTGPASPRLHAPVSFVGRRLDTRSRVILRRNYSFSGGAFQLCLQSQSHPVRSEAAATLPDADGSAGAGKDVNFPTRALTGF